MEANCRLFSRAVLWDITSAVLYKTQGEDDTVERGDGMFSTILVSYRACSCLVSVANLLDLQDQKLQSALRDWENEKWRFVSNKVGPGFTPQACQARALVLSGEAPEPEPDEEPVEENL